MGSPFITVGYRRLELRNKDFIRSIDVVNVSVYVEIRSESWGRERQEIFSLIVAFCDLRGIDRDGLAVLVDSLEFYFVFEITSIVVGYDLISRVDNDIVGCF